MLRRKHSGAFNADVFELLDVKGSLDRKVSAGSTAPAMVKKEVRRWKRRLKDA